MKHLRLSCPTGRPAPRSLRLAGLAIAVAALSAPGLALAQSNAQQLYRDALQACNSGQTTQSRADCLYEARSVLRDARQGRAWTREGGEGMDAPRIDRDAQGSLPRGTPKSPAPAMSGMQSEGARTMQPMQPMRPMPPMDMPAQQRPSPSPPPK